MNNKAKQAAYMREWRKPHANRINASRREIVVDTSKYNFGIIEQVVV